MLGTTPLKTIREDRGIPRYKAAYQIGVTDRTLAYYEAGERFPPLDRLVSICRLYGVDPNTLCGWGEQASA